MPTGRAVHYQIYDWDDLKEGVTLDPPEAAHRVYLLAEGGPVRYIISADGERPTSSVGMPLIPEFPEEFDCDLQYVHLRAGAQDVRLHAYYYSSA
jgi:hypothetical protein